jgi:TonB family protein
MIELALRSATIFALAAGINGLWRRTSAAQRHAIWMSAFASVSLLWLAPNLPLHMIPAISISVVSQGESFAIPGLRRNPIDYLAILWTTGTLLLLLRLALSYIWLRVGRNNVATPLAVGVFRPEIYLPEAAATWPAALRRSVILHEEAHIQRRDTLAQLFAQMVCALVWFQPLAWYAARRAAVERERACDDLVLAGGVDTVLYAGHLVDIARESVRIPTTAMGMARRSSLEVRLRALTNQSLSRAPLTSRWWLCLMLGLTIISFTIAALRAQEGGRVYKSGDAGVVAPKLTHKIDAKYSQAAQDRGVMGVVTLSFEIDKTGKPRNIEVIKSLDPELDKSAQAAVAEYRFDPATKEGMPVVFVAVVRVGFKLQ